jgi:hypothetical protein
MYTEAKGCERFNILDQKKKERKRGGGREEKMSSTAVQTPK